MSANGERDGSRGPTPRDRECAHRAIDEILTERVEAFLAERSDRHESFTSAELAAHIGVPRFKERDAHLLMVALMGQGRVRCDHVGWRPVRTEPR